MKTTILSLAGAVTLATLPVAADAQHAGHDMNHMGNMQHMGADHSGAARCDPSKGCPNEIAVTSEGFQPSRISVKRGETVKLVVTRKTDRTCAKEIVVADYGIRKALPLNEPVTIELTPRKTGEIRYSCGMNMLSGVLVVE